MALYDNFDKPLDTRGMFLLVAAALLGEDRRKWPQVASAELAVLAELADARARAAAAEHRLRRMMLLENAVVQLRECATIFRAYETEHRAKSMLVGVGSAEYADRTAKADRNGDHAKVLENYLSALEQEP